MTIGFGLCQHHALANPGEEHSYDSSNINEFCVCPVLEETGYTALLLTFLCFNSSQQWSALGSFQLMIILRSQKKFQMPGSCLY